MTGFYGYSSSVNRANETRPNDKEQPVDTVSYIIWHVYFNDPAFFTASWDGFVRFYTIIGSGSSSF